MGAFAWDLSFRLFRLRTFAWEPSLWSLHMGNFSLGVFVWDPSLCNLSLRNIRIGSCPRDLPLANCAKVAEDPSFSSCPGTFVCDLSLWNSRLESPAWKFLCPMLQLGVVAWDLVPIRHCSLGAFVFFRFGASAWDLSLGPFSLGPFAWELWLGSFCLFF